MRIIHLSDIHYRDTQKQNEIISKLIEDLKKNNDKEKIDLILITGDLINKGGKDFENLNTAFNKFDENVVHPLIDSIGIDKNRIIFCPGNHDINRNNIDEFGEDGLKNRLINNNEVDNFINKRQKDFDSSILRIKEFKDFEKNFYDDSSNNTITNFESNYRIDIDGMKIGITAFNSSWRCSGNDSNNIILGKKQIENSKNLIKDCDVKIALMHHSFEFFKEFEKREVRNKIADIYDYLLIGHVHTNDSYVEMGISGSYFVSIAQSNSSDNIDEKNILYSIGYSILDLNFTSDQIKVTGRRFSNNINTYVPNVDVFGEEGFKIYPMILDEEKESEREKRKLLDKIRDIHLEDFNEHLLSFKTDSKAPKTIDGIFINPRIVGEKQKNIDDSNKEREYSLDEICSMDKNILLFGTKESGKTILVDRLVIEFIEKYDKYKKLPIRIDLNNILTSSMESEIKRYLSVTRSESKKLIENNDIILIVDNLSFLESDLKNLGKLKKFINDNKKIRIIATSQTKIEKEVPIAVAKDDIFREFINLYITTWRSKEINNIISLWYSNKNNIDEVITVNEVVNIFEDTKMLITPLNISMFLWIMEHQQSYRLINKGKLMECFFEHLLQKLKEDDMYSDTFDYTNKIRLLSNIAYEMYINEKNKYKIEHLNLLEFTKEYIRKRKFMVDYMSIIEYFINKGIFIEQKIDNDRYFVFRFECFYRFFITQYMLIESDFKDYVLQEERYLQFQEEIDYFTGINRDEVGILNLLTDRMENIYNKYHEELCSDEKTLDYYFEVENALSDRIQIKDIEKIKETREEYDPKSIVEYKNDEELSKIGREVAIGEVKEVKFSSEVDVWLDLWRLVAKVLKNTEETNEHDIKNNVYKKVLKNSILNFVIYKKLIDSTLEQIKDENNDMVNLQITNDMSITSKLIPIINSDEINRLLATNKLEMVIAEECNEYLFGKNLGEYSDLEKFITIMLYLKINNKEAIKYLKKFSKEYSCRNTKDLLIVKLIYEYYNTINKSIEKEYISIISELVFRKEKSMFKNHKKSQLIKKLESGKKNYNSAVKLIK